MDLVTCEAPLDNSFQKERRELVNKGSLGRRRKPSRSNLRLILSPSSDQQDTTVLNGHHNGDAGDFVQANGTSCSAKVIRREETTSVCQRRVKISNDNHRQNVKPFDSQLQVAANNYKNVIASINELQKVSGEDSNSNTVVRANGAVGNSHRVNGEKGNHQGVINKDYNQNKVNGQERTTLTFNSRDCKSQNSPGDVNGNSYNRFSTTNDCRTKSPCNYDRQKLSFKFENNDSNFRHSSQLSYGGVHQTNQEKVTSNRGFNAPASKQNGDSSKQNFRSSSYDPCLNGRSPQSAESGYQQNVITFSNSRKIVTSTPIQRNTASVKHDNHNRIQGSVPYIEPSLPRTSEKPNLVAEAQQFSIEAKLRRKKSEAQGRSAVLIQTWERRTQSSDSRGDSKTPLKNRFGGKDSSFSVMPDSYIRSKHKGSLENGRQTDDLLSRVRDANCKQSMLYHGQDSRFSACQPSRTVNDKVVVNGKSSGQEPEWVSLSRKLCAKFVEGHSGRNSPDSYVHEEPEGVSKTFSSSNEAPRTAPTSSRKDSTPRDVPGTLYHPSTKEGPRMKSVSAPDAADSSICDSGGPPWIHLSRKLCNKFIEEHIEYPPITNGHFVEVPELVEPNGDIRIIEKVGKPKRGKSKQKDSQPEWVSLSKKLRAKFIESHIDDPETIALDNQLNASDPEETSSTESLSDGAHDVDRGAVRRNANFKYKDYHRPQDTSTEDGRIIESKNHIQRNISTPSPAKECCWEYQEMEFDQESNSGTFQEAEHSDEYPQEARIQRGCLPEDNTNHYQAFNQKFQDFQVSECFNNDVHFAEPTADEHSSNHQQKNLRRLDSSEGRSSAGSAVKNKNQPLSTSCRQENSTRSSNSHQQSESFSSSFKQTQFTPQSNSQGRKHITVQFISSANKNRGYRPAEHDCDNNLQRVKQSAIHGSFFNLSTWEESHYRQDSPKDSLSPKQEYFDKNARSKSLDNLLDSLDGSLATNTDSAKDGIARCPRILMSDAEEKTNGECDEVIFRTPEPDFGNPEYFRGDKSKSSTDDSYCESTARLENSIKCRENRHDSHKTAVGSVVRRENGVSFQRHESSKVSGEASFMDQYIETVNEELKNDSRVQGKDTSRCHDNRTNFQRKASVDDYNDIYIDELVKPNTTGKDTHSYQVNVQNVGKTSSKNGGVYQHDGPREFEGSERKRDDRKDFKFENAESSSEGEGFDNRKDTSVDDSRYGKISSLKESMPKHEIKIKQQTSHIKATGDNSDKKDRLVKCNGMIPNSIYTGLSENKTTSTDLGQNEKPFQSSLKGAPKLGMSKWITVSKSEQNAKKDSDTDPNKTQNSERRSSGSMCDSGEVKLEKRCFEQRYSDDRTPLASSESASPQFPGWQDENRSTSHFEDGGSEDIFGPVKEFDMKNRCKSLCDVSFTGSSQEQNQFQHHESVDNLASASKSSNFEFQHFEYESDIPLCAKLVSNQDRKKSSEKVRSGSSSIRTQSPCLSETSHVYEDMFKETPSDSEASSWTAVKNHSYYVNGRSSSMNDLDYSDSCSLSVKCDYASSSENSTLQSRRSSHASSSFYVNLRDYDSHMLEPGLNKPRRNDSRSVCNGKSSSTAAKGSPPTPESLRHLFTSPLNSIHSPPNRTSRLISRMPSDPQSHYYSTAAAATSSAFKHGFAPEPPKPKKTERTSSIKIKDIAHGIILTFKRFQNHSKASNVSPTQYVDVSHLAEMNSSSHKGDSGKDKKSQLDSRRENGYWTENGKTDTDSGFLSDVQRAKARRSSSDLTGMRSNPDISEKKKSKNSKKNNKEKGKKGRSKVTEPRTIPTVSRKVQQGADGTLYLVTTVSGDTSALPGVYSDSPDTSSEISTHPPVRQAGESNC